MQTERSSAVQGEARDAMRLLVMVSAADQVVFVDPCLGGPAAVREGVLAELVARGLRGESFDWSGAVGADSFRLCGEPLFDASGQLVQLVITGTEVGGRASWAGGRSDLATLMDSTDDALWSVSREMRLIVGNRFFVENYRTEFGIQVQPGMTLDQMLPPDRLADMHAYWSALYQRALAGESFHTEQHYPFGGSERFYVVSLYPIRQGGEVVGVACSTKDITERREGQAFEEALRHSQERFSHVFRGSPVAHCIIGLEGALIDVNESFLKLTGQEREQVIGQPGVLARLLPGLSPTGLTLAQLMAQAVESQTPVRDVNLELFCGAGETRAIELTLAAIELDGRTGLLGHLHDVTERSRLEQQLRQAQKMEAIGRLAGGVAHDFNNIMTVILGYGQLLEAQSTPGSLQRRGLEKITRSASKAAALTEQLLAFGRKQVLEPRVLDLAELVEQLATLVQRVIGEDVEVSLLVDPRAGRVRADKVQMQQVLLNLAVNAREAMPRGGKLTVAVDSVEVGEALARQKLGLHRGRYVLMQVSDNGVGMDPETQAHIFEPFFTTKEIGQGSGLGLATVYGIVTQTGGHILVDSQVGQGTTFRIFLPKVEEGDMPVVSTDDAQAGPVGHETVLLVEDETDVRELVGLVLEQHGYTVLAASSGTEAMRLLSAYAGRVDLLLTDVVMPEMNGRQVAERVLSIRPGTRVLFMSGYPGQAITKQGILEPGTALLRKPFSAETLAIRVRDLLDQAA